MTFDEIQQLINQFNQSPMSEFDLDFDGVHLHLSKQMTTTQVVESTTAPAPTSEAVTTTQAPAPIPEPAPDVGVQASSDEAINAPLVGIVYLQPAPDQEQYKKVGDHVQKGDVVCVIEAMKMMTEVKSDISGVISDILVSNEEVVEYDQPLIQISPE